MANYFWLAVVQPLFYFFITLPCGNCGKLSSSSLVCLFYPSVVVDRRRALTYCTAVAGMYVLYRQRPLWNKLPIFMLENDKIQYVYSVGEVHCCATHPTERLRSWWRLCLDQTDRNVGTTNSGFWLSLFGSVAIIDNFCCCCCCVSPALAAGIRLHNAAGSTQRLGGKGMKAKQAKHWSWLVVLFLYWYLVELYDDAHAFISPFEILSCHRTARRQYYLLFNNTAKWTYSDKQAYIYTAVASADLLLHIHGVTTDM